MANVLVFSITVFSSPFIQYKEKTERANKKTNKQNENNLFELIGFSFTFLNNMNSLIFSEAKSKIKTVMVRIKIIKPAVS